MLHVLRTTLSLSPFGFYGSRVGDDRWRARLRHSEIAPLRFAGSIDAFVSVSCRSSHFDAIRFFAQREAENRVALAWAGAISPSSPSSMPHDLYRGAYTSCRGSQRSALHASSSRGLRIRDRQAVPYVSALVFEPAGGLLSKHVTASSSELRRGASVQAGLIETWSSASGPVRVLRALPDRTLHGPHQLDARVGSAPRSAP